MKEYNVIGLMSGTSLDGIDIAYCRFKEDNGQWSFIILLAVTIDYPDYWIKKLTNIDKTKARAFVEIDIRYGIYLGELIKDFIEKNKIEVDFIGSHGHTAMHEPSKKITYQIGNGAAIAAVSAVTVVSNFRQMDVILGGEGAPLVPLGDRLLFGDYDMCLNLGGFSNISFEKDNKRVAFDICPVNIALNFAANSIGKKYDKNGSMAGSGETCHDMVKELNDLEYYFLDPPKSLGKEWLVEHFLPVINRYDIPAENKLRSLVEHISLQISNVISTHSGKNVLATGGGVYNRFLMEMIKEKTDADIIIPDPLIIEFKEALIFAFLGVLRMRNEINCLCSVTGAERDSCSGAIYF